MQSEELIGRAAVAMCKQGGFDPYERMPNDGPRWKYYVESARAALEAALSAAEPVAFRPSYQQIKDTVQANINRMHRAGESHLMMARWLSADLDKLYPQPAPSVAVKALDWRDAPVPPSGETLAPSVVGLYCIPHSGDRFYLRFRDKTTLGDYSTLDKAKAAAQADYEARIRSTLSAQVQDVAGWQSMDTAPKDGSEFAAGRRYSPDGEFVVHTYRWVGPPNYWNSKRNGTCIRPSYQADYLWCPLPAAPAKQEGGTNE